MQIDVNIVNSILYKFLTFLKHKYLNILFGMFKLTLKKRGTQKLYY